MYATLCDNFSFFYNIVIGNSILCAITARRGNNKNEQHQWRVENIMRNYGHFIYASMNLCFMLSSAFCVNWLSVYYYNIEQVSVHTASHERWRVNFLSFLMTEMMMIQKRFIRGFVITMKNPKKYVRSWIFILGNYFRKVFPK